MKKLFGQTFKAHNCEMHSINICTTYEMEKVVGQVCWCEVRDANN